MKMIIETPCDRQMAAKRIQESINKQWEEEFYPFIYRLFEKDTKPNKPGKYVEMRSRGGIVSLCELNDLKFTEIEVACNPSIKWPVKRKALEALFNGRGQERAFASLKRQVLCECCKALSVADHKPKNINTKGDYFEQFINGVLDLQGNKVYGCLAMSPITVMAADDIGNLSDDPEEHREPTMGMVVYLTMRLWVKCKKDNENDTPTN